MKLLPFSMCTSLALVGSLACGSSGKPGGTGSNVNPIGMSGATSAPGGAGSAPNVAPNGAGGAGYLIDPGPVGGATASGDGKSCSGNTTTISGFVYDPADKNPLYNISVYVLDPTSPLPDLDKIPVACGCSQLLPEKVLAIGAPTDATGHFQIPCAPSGTVSLVVQTGKWRRRYDGVTVLPNQDNAAPRMRLPKNSAEGSLPNIAISTGASDSFECLPLRLGVSASEYVAGSAPGGHIHIYSGRSGARPAAGAVDSYQTLWDTQEHLKEHDVVILSCEGQETTGGAPQTGGGRGGSAVVNATAQQYLMNYANTGGRVFASHFHYAWFNTGPFATGANNLAQWTTGQATIDDSQPFQAEVNTTLTGGAVFPEGAALAQWLGGVGALTNNQLPVWFARNNVQALVQPPSTEWLHLSASSPKAASAVQYFSVDTPIGAPSTDVCGRVVYSALHVSGGPGKSATGVLPDYPELAAGMMTPGMPAAGMGTGIVPDGCADHPLTPQEAALEFMLFDLSSCLIPIGEEPPVVVR